MSKKEELPQDPMIDYSKDGVPISRELEKEAVPNASEVPKLEGTRDAQRSTTENATPSGNPADAGFTGGAHNKKRQGTEDAQKRSDTGTGL